MQSLFEGLMAAQEGVQRPSLTPRIRRSSPEADGKLVSETQAVIRCGSRSGVASQPISGNH